MFSAFFADFLSLPHISDYHHLNVNFQNGVLFERHFEVFKPSHFSYLNSDLHVHEIFTKFNCVTRFTTSSQFII